MSQGPWKRCWGGGGHGAAPVLTEIPPLGAHVRPPLPPPLPRQFLHHPAGCAPEIPQSAAREQERMRLGLPLPAGSAPYGTPARKGFCTPYVEGVGGFPHPGGSLLLSPGFCGLCGPLTLCWRGRPGPQPCGELGPAASIKGEAQWWLQVCSPYGRGSVALCATLGSWGSRAVGLSA